MAATHAPDIGLISRINALLGEVDGPSIKQASELGTTGQGSKDPGGYKGPSSHPSAKTDSYTQSAPLGSRAKENESDVKEDHPGSGVDNVSPGSGGDQDSHQLHIGMNPRATGEDPSVEDDYKGDKDDPGTSHPANAEDVGDKYASMQMQPLLKLAFDKMNNVLADIANGNHITYYESVLAKRAQAQQDAPANGQANGHAKQAAQQATPPASAPDEAGLAASAGYELADAVILQTQAEKRAAAAQIIEQTIRDAEHDADLVGDYLTKYAQARQEPQQPQQPQQPSKAQPPIRLGKESIDQRRYLRKLSADSAAAGEGEDDVPPEMAAALAGGGGGGAPGGDMGGGPPPDMGGAGLGGAPGGDMGMGGGMGGGVGGEGGDHEAAVNELFNALAKLGIPPEELLMAAQSAGGEEGGGPPGGGGLPGGPPGGPPEGGGLPPEMAGKAASAQLTKRAQYMAHHIARHGKEVATELAKLARATCMLQNKGRVRIVPVAPNTKEAEERQAVINYIYEVCGFRN